MSDLSVWDLLQQGRFEDACAHADAEHNASGSLLPLRNKVFALLQMQKNVESIRLSEEIIKLSQGNTDSDFVFLGVANWLERKPQRAVEVWKSGEAAAYTDAAGGVEVPMLLLFAAVVGGNKALEMEAIGKLRKAAKSKKISNWPGPLVGFLLGHIDEHAVTSCLSQSPSLRAKQAAQADFYSAVRALMSQGDEAAYRAKLKACISHGPASIVKAEPYLAKAELSKSPSLD